ncbi:MAG: helix-turn-helix transcriptional regulator [Burkholderiales bacterium]
MRLPLSFFMKSAFHSYLRKRRRQYGLSQDDIATILGVYSRSHVSMLETGDRRPSAEQVYILHLLFGEPDEQLFPGLFGRARLHLKDSVRRLLGQENPTRSGSAGRRKLLEEALARLETGRDNKKEV